MRIYLDHNATTPGDPLVVDAMMRAIADDFGNPSSVHHFGQQAKAALDEARMLGARTAWLGVWEFNPRAIAFYKKCGFMLVGDHDFLFADVVQTDLVMSRPL